MAIKNFIFRENCVGSEVDGIEIAFFAIFDHVELLKQNFNFQSIRKTKPILYYYQLCEFKTD